MQGCSSKEGGTNEFDCRKCRVEHFQSLTCARDGKSA